MVVPKVSLVAISLLQLLGTAEAYVPAARLSTHSAVLSRADDLLPEYDYIIVGGGTSGLTVADRLTQDGKCMLAAMFCHIGTV